MGGFGSGRWADVVNRKIPVEMCRCLSIKQFKDADFLHDGRSGEITFTNTAGNVTARFLLKIEGMRPEGLRLQLRSFDRESMQEIDITQTPCNYGGLRYWFRCPVCKAGVYCGSRATKLYLPPNAKLFGCRKCYDLSRLSVQENHKRDRTAKHIEKADLENLSISQAMRLGGL